MAAKAHNIEIVEEAQVTGGQKGGVMENLDRLNQNYQTCLRIQKNLESKILKQGHDNAYQRRKWQYHLHTLEQKVLPRLQAEIVRMEAQVKI